MWMFKDNTLDYRTESIIQSYNSICREIQVVSYELYDMKKVNRVRTITTEVQSKINELEVELKELVEELKSLEDLMRTENIEL